MEKKWAKKLADDVHIHMLGSMLDPGTHLGFIVGPFSGQFSLPKEFMSQPNTDQSGVLQAAMGRFPSGRYLLTASHKDVRSGVLVNWAGICSTDPMLICVSSLKGHAIDPLIRDSRSFAIGVIDGEDKLLERRFGQMVLMPREVPITNEDDPFLTMPTTRLETGSPIIARCTTWFDCKVLRRIDLESETELFVGVVVGVMHNGEQVAIVEGKQVDDQAQGDDRFNNR